MSLYNKYRPKSLKTVVGNEEVVQSFKTMEAVPHAILLHGETGCGKTTMARIIAKMTGCAGADYREIDSADFRGIDTVRELRNQAQYSPLESEARVFVLDEAHKMTNDAQNALLKILEDTPGHVYFIICTTEPAKIISTVRGRCAQYQMSLLSDTKMKFLLSAIIKKENQKVSDQHLDLIIEQALGHPRNAIQLLEQALSVEEDNREKLVMKMAEQQSAGIELCRQLMKGGNWKTTANILTGLKEQDPEGIRRQVLGYAQAVLLKDDNVRAGLILESFAEPFYNTGFPGLILASYTVIKN